MTFDAAALVEPVDQGELIVEAYRSWVISTSGSPTSDCNWHCLLQMRFGLDKGSIHSRGTSAQQLSLHLW